MIRLDPTTGTLTSTHVDLIRLCLETRSYAAAEPILDNYIHSLPSQAAAAVREGSEYSVVAADIARSGEYIHKSSGHSDKVTYVDMQEYYVLGAMAYLGLRQFTKAQHFLEHVLIMPSANVANGLMLEAYKKWVLLNCLVLGEPRSVPRSANPTAIKQVRGASKAYEAVADAYKHVDNMSKLKAQVHAGTATWAEVSERDDKRAKCVLTLLGRQHGTGQGSGGQPHEGIRVATVTDVLGHAGIQHC